MRIREGYEGIVVSLGMLAVFLALLVGIKVLIG
jgi:hypothetical protein